MIATPGAIARLVAITIFTVVIETAGVSGIRVIGGNADLGIDTKSVRFQPRADLPLEIAVGSSPGRLARFEPPALHIAQVVTQHPHTVPAARAS